MKKTESEKTESTDLGLVKSELNFNVPNYTHELQMCDGLLVIKFDDSKYKYPNSFHRLMQRIFFGFNYKKL